MTLCHLTWYILYSPSPEGQELSVPTVEGPGPGTEPPYREHLTAACGTQRWTVGNLWFILSTQVGIMDCYGQDSGFTRLLPCRPHTPKEPH